VEYLVEKKGFVHYSVRAFLIEEIQKRNLPVDRDSMRIVADDLRAKYHPAYLAEQLYLQAAHKGENAIIESIRAVGEVNLLQEQPDFLLLAIDADQKLRYERAMSRGNESDHVDFEKFQAQEALEMSNMDPTRGNIAACMAMADFTVRNDGDISALHQQLDEFITKFIS
jgi:dephospho-CoA kinase